ncbi:hypothetical protein ACPEH1_19970 [Stenotrophomonas sp. NPDC077421]|uniref:hypothetical protein n=1 Tax=Stenotrophomonas sp. NPDC077421 TaxID=3414699 RepID=UPI001312F271
MKDIEKRARELVAALMQDDPDEGESWEKMACRKVTAALTPTEGYVLVPEDILSPLLRDAITAVEFVGGRAQSKPLSRRISERAWKLVEACPTRPRVNRG